MNEPMSSPYLTLNSRIILKQFIKFIIMENGATFLVLTFVLDV